MKRLLKKIIYLGFSITILVMPSLCAAELSISLGYPYLGVKYSPNIFPVFSGEFKYAYWEGVEVIAGRLYYKFWKKEGFEFYSGLEYGAIKFDYIGIKGSGNEYGIFFGAEARPLSFLGIVFDLGPSLVNLHDNQDNVSGLEWVANVAIQIYIR